MNESSKSAHSGFLRKSGLFILLNSFSVVWEIGFSGIIARLPEGDYSAALALLKVFFIVVTPIAALQSVVSKEVAAFSVLKEYGKRRTFVARTFQLSCILAVATLVLGLLFTPYIANLLNIGTTLPVILLFVSIIAYFPIPTLWGVVQGLKRFYLLAVLQTLWGALRFLFGFVIVIILARGLSSFMAGVAVATILISLVALLPSRQIFSHEAVPVERTEMFHAYSLVMPVIATLFCITIMKNVDVLFAKSFFSDRAADAYSCAALVGSGFFILSAVFLVMFPLVSEEKARGGDPIVFLLKSCLLVAFFSVIGLAVTLFAPMLPMYIVTLGESIPGAESLIRLIGFAVVPIILINLMTQYFLAKHQWNFLPVLAAGMILQLTAIALFHGSPHTMLFAIIAANSIALVGMVLFTWHDHRICVRQEQSMSVQA